MYIFLLLYMSCWTQKKVVSPIHEVQIDIEENRWVEQGLLLHLAIRSTDGKDHPLHRMDITAGRYQNSKDLSGQRLLPQKQTIQWLLPLHNHKIFIIQGLLVYGDTQKNIGFSAITAPTRSNTTPRSVGIAEL